MSKPSTTILHVFPLVHKTISTIHSLRNISKLCFTVSVKACLTLVQRDKLPSQTLPRLGTNFETTSKYSGDTGKHGCHVEPGQEMSSSAERAGDKMEGN